MHNEYTFLTGSKVQKFRSPEGEKTPAATLMWQGVIYIIN
jgi:hypothetical protein